MTTSCPSSTRRRARSSVISATATWRSAPWSNDEAITSPTFAISISVTSSGRSSARRMKIVTSGWLVAMPRAMLVRRVVLPALAGATTRAR